MILSRKCLLVDFFSLAGYQNHSHFASLQALISSPELHVCELFPNWLSVPTLPSY